jgi:hypothetical protein
MLIPMFEAGKCGSGGSEPHADLANISTMISVRFSDRAML